RIELNYPLKGIIKFGSEGQGNMVSLQSPETGSLAGFGAEPQIFPHLTYTLTQGKYGPVTQVMLNKFAGQTQTCRAWYNKLIFPAKDSQPIDDHYRRNTGFHVFNGDVALVVGGDD
ncbi:MAG: hypothetical protein ABFD49_05585, partial [Armatimonadota bacterium]